MDYHVFLFFIPLKKSFTQYYDIIKIKGHRNKKRIYILHEYEYRFFSKFLN